MVEIPTLLAKYFRSMQIKDLMFLNSYIDLKLIYIGNSIGSQSIIYRLVDILYLQILGKSY